MPRIESHRDLVAWQSAVELGLGVYRLTQSFPRDERFALTTQSRRAATSIAANIAEGFGRGSRPDYLRFLRMARGSLRELDTHLHFAQRLQYATSDELEGIFDRLEHTSRILAGLIRSIERLSRPDESAEL